MKRFLLAALLLPALGFAQVPAQYGALSLDDAILVSRTTGKPVAVYFMQPECPYCKRTEDALAQPDVSKALAPAYHFANINVRSADPAVEKLVRGLQVNGTPTFAFFIRGKVACVARGGQNEAQLRDIHAAVQHATQGGRLRAMSGKYPACRIG